VILSSWEVNAGMPPPHSNCKLNMLVTRKTVIFLDAMSYHRAIIYKHHTGSTFYFIRWPYALRVKEQLGAG